VVQCADDDIVCYIILTIHIPDYTEVSVLHAYPINFLRRNIIPERYSIQFKSIKQLLLTCVYRKQIYCYKVYRIRGSLCTHCTSAMTPLRIRRASR
jgi:hypothetical protein